MISIARDYWKDSRGHAQSVSRSCAVCDDCGTKSEPVYAESDFERAMMWAACKARGWTERIEGRMLRHVCPRHSAQGQLGLPGVGL